MLENPPRAEVESNSEEGTVYTTKITATDDDQLDVMCTCPARKLCWHAVAYYAVYKGLEPERQGNGGSEDQNPLALISEGVEKLVNGIGQLVDEKMRDK